MSDFDYESLKNLFAEIAAKDPNSSDLPRVYRAQTRAKFGKGGALDQAVASGNFDSMDRNCIIHTNDYVLGDNDDLRSLTGKDPSEILGKAGAGSCRKVGSTSDVTFFEAGDNRSRAETGSSLKTGWVSSGKHIVVDKEHNSRLIDEHENSELGSTLRMKLRFPDDDPTDWGYY